MFMVSRATVSDAHTSVEKENLRLETPESDLSSDLRGPQCKVATIVIDTPQEASNLEEMINAEGSCKARVVLSAKLFGPPRVSLNWKDRCYLMTTLQRLPTLTQLVFQGTTMGQVISCDLLSRGLPPSLESLTVNAGLILDDAEGIKKLAKALRQLPHLRELRFLNFLNHVRVAYPADVDSGRLLDPILTAVAEGCRSLCTLELSCLASFIEWQEPFLSATSLTKLFESCSALQQLELTHLNLSDVELEAIADHRSARLSRLVLNANENSSKGLARVIFGSCRIGSTISHLECINHVKLTEDMYDYLLWYTSLRQANCPLRRFQATLPLRLDPSLLQRQLRLQNLELDSRYYAPQISATVASVTLSRVADDPTCLYKLLRELPTIVSPGGWGHHGRTTKTKPPLSTGTSPLAQMLGHNGGFSATTRNAEGFRCPQAWHIKHIKRPLVCCLMWVIVILLLVLSPWNECLPGTGGPTYQESVITLENCFLTTNSS